MDFVARLTLEAVGMGGKKRQKAGKYGNVYFDDSFLFLNLH